MIPEHELRIMYHVNGMSTREIGELYGVHQSTVWNWMEDYGIEMRTLSEAHLVNSKKPSKEDLEEMYWSDGMSQREIGELCGVNRTTVQSWIRNYGIKTRTISEAHLINTLSTKPSKEDLAEMYWGDGMNTYEIGKLCKVSHSAVRGWLIDYGIKMRTHSEAHLGNLTKPSEAELRSMYIDDNMSAREIGKLCGVNGNTVLVWMKDYGIESRTISESTSGEKNGNWKNGISKQPYCYKFNNAFKEAVRERDNYTCQLCGCEQNGRRLSVHHIHYLKEDCYPDVVALCCSCNTRVNANRDYWEERFENELIARGLFCWSLSREIDNT